MEDSPIGRNADEWAGLVNKRARRQINYAPETRKETQSIGFSVFFFGKRESLAQGSRISN